MSNLTSAEAYNFLNLPDNAIIAAIIIMHSDNSVVVLASYVLPLADIDHLSHESVRLSITLGHLLVLFADRGNLVVQTNLADTVDQRSIKHRLQYHNVKDERFYDILNFRI